MKKAWLIKVAIDNHTYNHGVMICNEKTVKSYCKNKTEESLYDNYNSDLDDDEVWMIPCKHSDGEHIWYTYHVGKMNDSSDRQFNSWESFVEYMVGVRAIQCAKLNKKVA